MNICCYITTILSFVSYAPQVVKIIKTKHADDLSLMTWGIWVFGASTFELYCILSGDLTLLLSQSVELGWVILTLILTLKYRKSRNSSDKE